MIKIYFYRCWHIILVLPTLDCSLPTLANYFVSVPKLDSSIPILAYYFCFNNIALLYTNIGILFSVYQCWIPPYCYWYIIFLLPTLVSSIPILAYFFTNVGFLFINIGILSSFTHVGSLFTNIGLLFMSCQCWDI